MRTCMTTQYTYDGNNRLTQVTSWDPASSATFTYDASNNRTSVSNGYATTTFDYDAANRLRRGRTVVRKTGQGAGRTFESSLHAGRQRQCRRGPVPVRESRSSTGTTARTG